MIKRLIHDYKRTKWDERYGVRNVLFMFILAILSYIGRGVLFLSSLLLFPISQIVRIIFDKRYHFAEKLFWIFFGFPVIWLCVPASWIVYLVFERDLEMESRMQLLWDRIEGDEEYGMVKIPTLFKTILNFKN